MKENKITLEVAIPPELELSQEQKKKLETLFESAVVEVISGPSAREDVEAMKNTTKAKAKAKKQYWG